ncbi:hypothetical protein A2U01_0021374, partial [Trifolium medium]|nr:hypothetical protein [Trifolium medium]
MSVVEVGTPLLGHKLRLELFRKKEATSINVASSIASNAMPLNPVAISSPTDTSSQISEETQDFNYLQSSRGCGGRGGRNSGHGGHNGGR